jgi:chorismate mutase
MYLPIPIQPYHLRFYSEETIIFALIERAQYHQNRKINDSTSKSTSFRSPFGEPMSLLEWMLMETEKLHATVGRYAFFESFLTFPIFPIV